MGWLVVLKVSVLLAGRTSFLFGINKRLDALARFDSGGGWDFANKFQTASVRTCDDHANELDPIRPKVFFYDLFFVFPMLLNY